MQNTLNFPRSSGGFSCIMFLTANEKFEWKQKTQVFKNLEDVKRQVVGLQVGFFNFIAFTIHCILTISLPLTA